MNQAMVEKDFAPINRTVGERLRIEAAELRKRLSDVDAAIEALEGSPEVEKVLNLVSKVWNGY